jgi:hypothetical protein
MAVSITDTRTIVSDADATGGGWTGSTTPVLFTSDPDPVETTGSLGMAVSTSTQNIYYDIGAGIDLSAGMLVYVWVLANGTMDTTANGGVTLQLGESSGTDRVGFHVAGSDLASFRHAAGPVGWQCLLVDTANLPSGATAYSGTVGGLDLTAIDKFGAGFKTLSKALGNTANCFTDIIRYGNDGLVVGGGTSGYGNAGQFTEIAAADRSNTAAYGICRELGSTVFGLQGPLTFGTTSGTASTYFEDRSATVVFEDRSIGTGYYYISISGNSTGTNSFILGQTAGGTNGKDGCSLICPVGVGASLDATNANVNVVSIYGSTITGFNNGVAFGTSTSHLVYDTNFIGCGQIDPGSILFKNNRIANTTDSTTGAILLDSSGTSNWSDLNFTSGGTGHAIYITATGTYTFTNFFFSGYNESVLGSNLTSSSGSTDAMVYNNSGGSVTINISGGNNVSVRNGASATTTVNANQSLNLTVQDQATDPIQNAVVAVYNASDDTELANDETDANGEIPTVSIANGTAIYIRVRKSTSGTRYYPLETVATMDGDLNLTITLIEDTLAP